jgi:hypothetical protein
MWAEKITHTFLVQSKPDLTHVWSCLIHVEKSAWTAPLLETRITCEWRIFLCGFLGHIEKQFFCRFQNIPSGKYENPMIFLCATIHTGKLQLFCWFFWHTEKIHMPKKITQHTFLVQSKPDLTHVWSCLIQVEKSGHHACRTEAAATPKVWRTNSSS